MTKPFKYRTIPEYEQSLHNVLETALACHPRTFAVRVDLRLADIEPLFYCYGELIKRFIASLDSQIKAQQRSDEKKKKRVRPHVLRYFRVEEQVTAEQPHYHVVLFFNRDVYHRLGDFDSPYSLAYKIKKAWARALFGRGADADDAGGLVEFANKNGSCTYRLNAHTYDAERERFDKFVVGYLCKEYSKHISPRRRSIGYSYR